MTSSMHRWIRGLTRLAPDSAEPNSPFLVSSSLNTNTSTHFRRSNPLITIKKLRNIKPLAAALPFIHVTHTLPNPSSVGRMDSASELVSASAAAAESASTAAMDDFVHVEDDAVKSDSSHSDETESVVNEAVTNNNNNSLNINNDNDNGNSSHENGNSDRGDGGGAYERKELPEELAQRVMTLTCESTVEGGVCDVYLVGTAHVSKESCQEVQAVISYLKPQVVFLELCSSRVAVLAPRDVKIPTMGEMVEMWRKKQNLFGILYSWFLAKVASKLEVFPGAEFHVAFDEAMKYGGKVILGDRPVQITLRRTWAIMPLWHKTKLLSSLFFQAFSLPNPQLLSKMLKEMDNVDMLTLVIQEMSKHYPTLMETLVHERDKYMSSTLLRVASEHNSVVAVVGKGHLPGIKKHWEQPIEVRELLEMPSRKPVFSISKILTKAGVAVAGLSILTGIYLSIKK